jgi:hypothetical protein
MMAFGDNFRALMQYGGVLIQHHTGQLHVTLIDLSLELRLKILDDPAPLQRSPPPQADSEQYVFVRLFLNALSFLLFLEFQMPL